MLLERLQERRNIYKLGARQLLMKRRKEQLKKLQLLFELQECRVLS